VSSRARRYIPSSVVSGERDLSLKSKLAAALEAAGYYTRLDVKLAAEARANKGRSRPMELTDIDVLALAFGADLAPNIVVGDCTTRGRISPTARGFWLSGVLTFFGADRAYLVLSQDPDLHERQSMARLGIEALSDSGLDRWLERLPNVQSPEDRLQRHVETEASFTSLSRELDELVEYRKYGFWQAEPNQSLLQLIRVVRSHAPALDQAHPHHRVLFLDLCLLLSLSLLRFSHAVFHVVPNDLPDAARSFLFGGSRSLRYREQLLERMKELLTERPASGAQMGEFALDPDYWPALLDLITRLARRPNESRRLPLEFAALLKTVTGDETPTMSRKLAWDVGRFLVRAARLPAGFELPFKIQPEVEQPALLQSSR